MKINLLPPWRYQAKTPRTKPAGVVLRCQRYALLLNDFGEQI